MKCFFFGHKWNLFRGFHQEVPHYDAICKRCGKAYKDYIVQYE